ncbi:hypothetical protein MRX96_026513 [Rhipicephalus microplus]
MAEIKDRAPTTLVTACKVSPSPAIPPLLYRVLSQTATLFAVWIVERLSVSLVLGDETEPRRFGVHCALSPAPPCRWEARILPPPQHRAHVRITEWKNVQNGRVPL